MSSVRIDRNAVYVPEKYIGKHIVLVERDQDASNGITLDNVGSYAFGSGGAINHHGRALYGVLYDIYCYDPREYIGSAYKEDVEDQIAPDFRTFSAIFLKSSILLNIGVFHRCLGCPSDRLCSFIHVCSPKEEPKW